MNRRSPILAAIIVCVSLCGFAQQVADPNFSTRIDAPAYSSKHPLVRIDEAHNNFHTADGRYRPFAELLRSDGYRVEAGKLPFGKDIGADVLVISNARGVAKPGDLAFTAAECDALYDWVRAGGSLLLIADHAPFGAAAANLGARFGVSMGKGFAMDIDPQNILDGPSSLVYSDTNKLLGDHSILRGRSERERVHKIVAFTGQSMTTPPGATVLMKIGPNAFELSGREDTEAVLSSLGYQGMQRVRDPDPAVVADLKAKHGIGGRAQGLAMTVGKGRVVMLGEAAMLSAQVITFEQDGKRVELKMGMNVEGTDDRQFALNVLHWLSRLFD